MASKTLVARAERVLRFMFGVRHPEIAQRLAKYGFGEADYQEGWRLIQAAAGQRLSVDPPPRPLDPQAVDALDAWEDEWYPIISATLVRRHPEAHAAVFLNLRQTSGPEVIITVSTLLDRIDALGETERQSLQRRGVTDEVLGAARALIQEVGTLPAPPLAVSDPAAVETAERALWAWYLEWSEIARAAIRNGQLLKKLGYNVRKPGRPRVLQVEDDPTFDDDPPHPASLP